MWHIGLRVKFIMEFLPNPCSTRSAGQLNLSDQPKDEVCQLIGLFSRAARSIFKDPNPQWAPRKIPDVPGRRIELVAWQASPPDPSRNSSDCVGQAKTREISHPKWPNSWPNPAQALTKVLKVNVRSRLIVNRQVRGVARGPCFSGTY